tara:strand:- start:42 stop:392 length:351 start_codon:yes stop_codon:yes gene_type:complete
MKALKQKNIKFLNQIIKENIHGDFSHADDICSGIYKILNNKKKITKIILSSNKSSSINNIINYVIKKNHIKLKLNFNKVKQKGLFILGDSSLAKKTLRWKHEKNIFIAAQDIYRNL